MKPSIYLETSFISYLTAPQSANIIVAAHQQITQEGWDAHRLAFELFVSPLVIDEVSQGEVTQAAKRLAALKGISILDSNNEVAELAAAFLQQQVVPSKASDDAYHIAMATVYRINYLLTWNCKHIANAQLHSRLRQISNQRGYELPVLCTPYELFTPEN
jgi:predicted nucleic acid-binding protein